MKTSCILLKRTNWVVDIVQGAAAYATQASPASSRITKFGSPCYALESKTKKNDDHLRQSLAPGLFIFNFNFFRETASRKSLTQKSDATRFMHRHYHVVAKDEPSLACLSEFCGIPGLIDWIPLLFWDWKWCLSCKIQRSKRNCSLTSNTRSFNNCSSVSSLARFRSICRGRSHQSHVSDKKEWNSDNSGKLCFPV